MIEEIEISGYPESFLEANFAELYAYPLEVVEGYMDQSVRAQEVHHATIFAREIIRRNRDDSSDSTYGAYRILAAAYDHRGDRKTAIYLLGVMIKKFTALERELRKVLQRLTQGWPKREVYRILSEHRRRPHLCSYNLLFKSAERAKERGDIQEEIEFRRTLAGMTPDKVDVLINLAAVLSKAGEYQEEITIREKIGRILMERQGVRNKRNSELLIKARALEARRNLSPQDREPKNRDY